MNTNTNETEPVETGNPEPGFFYIIPSTVFGDPELPPSAKLLFGLVSALTRKRGFAWATNDHLAGELGTNAETVRRLLAELETRGHLTREIIRDATGAVVERRLFISGRPPLPSSVRGDSSPQKTGDPSPPDSEAYKNTLTSIKRDAALAATRLRGFDGLTIPASHSTEAFVEAWGAWIKARRARGRFAVETAERQLANLSKFPVEVGVAAINRSLDNGWMGLFPDRATRPAGEAARRRAEGSTGFDPGKYIRPGT